MRRLRRKNGNCQYNYPHTDNTLFSTVALTLKKRGEWLKQKNE